MGVKEKAFWKLDTRELKCLSVVSGWDEILAGRWWQNVEYAVSNARMLWRVPFEEVFEGLDKFWYNWKRRGELEKGWTNQQRSLPCCALVLYWKNLEFNPVHIEESTISNEKWRYRAERLLLRRWKANLDINIKKEEAHFEQRCSFCQIVSTIIIKFSLVSGVWQGLCTSKPSLSSEANLLLWCRRKKRDKNKT